MRSTVPIWLLFLFLGGRSVQAGDDWIACGGSQGGGCRAPSGEPTVVSYVYPGGTVYFFAEGFTVPCTSDVFGGPNVDDRTCFRRPINVQSAQDLDFPLPTDFSSSRVAELNAQLNVNYDQKNYIRWVYLGTGNPMDSSSTTRKGIYFLHKGNDLDCKLSNFGPGFDFAVGVTKKCWVSTKKFSAKPAVPCAEYGSVCDMSGSEMPYRLMHMRSTSNSAFSVTKITGKPSATCDVSNFKPMTLDPDFVHSVVCYYQDVSQFFNPVGFWHRLAAGPGVGVELTRGYSRTSTTSKTKSWNWGLSATITAGYEFAAFNAEVSVTGSYGQESSITTENSLTNDQSQSCSATCDGFLWQWKFTAHEVCAFGKTDCPIDIGTCFFACTPTYQKPNCPIDLCTDTACNNCTLTNGRTYPSLFA